MNNHSFQSLNLTTPILRALSDEGYTEPTPVQAAAIPEVLAGRDLMATAQTGTGKTAAFALPMLQLLAQRSRGGGDGDRHAAENTHSRPGRRGGASRSGRRIARAVELRALILSPTRELALQIDESLRAYGRYLPLRTAVVLGGVPAGRQIRALAQGPDILVATPGRLLDLAAQGHVRLNHVDILVLDEADRMLDMGFIHDVRKIVAQCRKTRQTLLFSATLSPAIADLAGDMLREPTHIEVARAATVAGKIVQKVLFVRRNDKLALLESLLRERSNGRTLVFTRTKHKADRVAKTLLREGISAAAIHSNKTQGARQRALAGFERGHTRVLVATDIMARGIDVDGIADVINYELPDDAENYVHRIGRTARAGADGNAFSFCDADELSLLRAIENLTDARLDAHADHPYHCERIGSMRRRGGGSGGRSGRSRFVPRRVSGGGARGATSGHQDSSGGSRTAGHGGGNAHGGSRTAGSGGGNTHGRNRSRPGSRRRRTYR